jgi:pimeloyl-ACP methyl ester carboxylesterase
MSQPELAYIDVGERAIAYRIRSGRDPTLLFLPGYSSDMEGAKALALDAFAEQAGLAMLRLDYSGTGSSGGDFEDGTLARWIEETLAAIDRLTTGPLIVIGSSMGGWIALHVALLRPERTQGVVGIAAAPDFTEWGFSEAQKAELQANGRLGPDPQIVTLRFWESGQSLKLLDRDIAIGCPIRMVHGERDEDVPLEIAFQAMRRLRSADVQLLTIKGGGHRLSEPHEIDASLKTGAGLLEL